MVLYAKWIETNLSLNGVYYDNLGAAVDAAQDGDEIVVVQDYTEKSTMWNLRTGEPGISVTLNLNGKKISFPNDFGGWGALLIENFALTINGEKQVPAWKHA